MPRNFDLTHLHRALVAPDALRQMLSGTPKRPAPLQGLLLE